MILRGSLSIQSIVGGALSSGVSYWWKMKTLVRSCYPRTFSARI